MRSFRRRLRQPPLRPGALRAAARSIVERLEGRVLLSGSDPAPPAPFLPPGHELFATSALLSPPTAGQPLDVALAFLRSHASALGITAADLANPLVTDQYTDSDTGETHIYLRQRINGLQVEDADISISLTRDNQVIAAGSHFIANAASLVSAARTSAAPLSLNASQALEAAAPNLGLTLGSPPTMAAAGQSTAAISVGPSTSTTLLASDASVDPIPAKLVYIPTPSGLRLGWDMVLRTPDGQHWYDARIDGRSGELLGAVDFADPLGTGTNYPSAPQISAGASSASANDTVDLSGATESYNVYPLPLKSPDEGSRQILTSPADPTFSPFGWLDINGKPGADSTLTTGNNVNAYVDAADTGLPAFQADGGPSLSFDSPLDLSQNPDSYMSAAVTQLFYVTNTVHDIYAHYGFTEAAGNFQQIDYGGQGLGGDPLQAEAQDGGGVDNSNFFTPPDGQSPVMQMYVWDKTSPNRDGDLDNTIIIHEYTHGLSTRLTGGASNSTGLFALQSSGMAEGWSDWFAMMLTQKPTDTAGGAYGIGAYVLGQGPGGPGIRQDPYSFDMSVDPLTFADFGNGGSVEAHSTGTIWGSALWDLNWLLIQKYGYSPNISQGYNAAIPGENGGNNLAIKLVMDALKIQPSNPSFTDARDAILAADRALDGGQDALQIWTAFARRGLGFSAVDDSSVSGSVSPAFDLPPSLQGPRIIAQSLMGTQTAPVGSIDLTFSTPMDPTSFSIANDVASFTGPGGVDLRPQITGFNWLNGNTTLEIDFNPVSVNGQYALVISPFILSAASQTPLDQNANGIAGEVLADQYAAIFGYTNNPLTVTSVDPAPGSVVALPLTTLDVGFSGPVDPASIDPYALVLSRGAVVGATALNATTVRYQLSGLGSEGPLTITLPAGALKDGDGNDSAAYSQTLSVDIVSTPFPAPLFAETPAAPLVSERTTTGTIAPAGDSDSFTLTLAAGQALTGVVSAADGSSLQPRVDLLDGLGQLLASSSAGAPGQPAILQTGPIAAGGTYTLRISGAAGTAGDYSIRAILNAAVESEQFGGPPDQSIAAAQNIDGSFISLGAGVSRGAVLGQLASGGSVIAADDFSEANLGPAWTTYSSDPNNGEVFISSAANRNILAMDHNDPTGSTFNLNEAVWTVDLSNLQQATLSFEQTSFGDEQDTLPTDFTGHADGDGVSISDDNVHWRRVWDGVTTDMQGLFGSISINLAVAAAQAGMTLGPNFKIKFQQYDNYDIPLDGRAFANVRIISPVSAGDFYSFTANAGDAVSAQVIGQDVTGGEQLSVYDSAGNLLAAGIGGGSNADLAFNNLFATSTGTYYAGVFGDTNGHYLLTITKAAGLQPQPASLQGNITYPASASVISVLPQIDLTLSQPVLFSSVTSGALTIDGIASASVVMLDGQTLAFILNRGLDDGLHTIAIAAGAFNDLNGDPVAAMTSTFTIQSGAPRVIASSIAEGAVVPKGDLTVSFTFSRTMTAAGLEASAIQVFGPLHDQTFFPAEFGFDASGTIFTATFSGLPDDNYTLTLLSGPGGFEDSAGNALDGEPHWPLGPTGSGNGVPGGNFFVDFTLDTTTADFPTPLQPVSPLASLVYTGTTAGAINTPADTDSYAITLVAGQSISAILAPLSGWQPTIGVLGPNGAMIGSTIAASGDGADAVLESAFAPTSGIYTLVVSSGDNAGLYSLQLVLDALVESESRSGASNDSPATAQDLDSSFGPIDAFHAGDRAAVVGTIDSTFDEPDFYSLNLHTGDHITLGADDLAQARLNLSLQDSSGTVLAATEGAGLPVTGFTASIDDFVAPADGTYFIEVMGQENTDYNLLILRNARLATQPIDTTGKSLDLSATGVAVGYLSGTSADPFDYYNFAASQGNVLAIRTDTPGGTPGPFFNFLDPRIDLFDPTGAIVASDDNSAPDRRNAGIFYTVPAGGNGVYYVRIEPARGSGEYALIVDGAAAPPAAGAPDLLAATDSGASSTDNITNFNNSSALKALRFLVSNTVGGAKVGIYANNILIGHGTAAGATLTITTDGKTTLTDGTYSIIARQTLSDGTTLPDSAPLQVTIMTHAPLLPGAPSLDPTSDRGVHSTDNITNVSLPIIDIPTPLFWRMFRNGTLVSSSIARGPTFHSSSLGTGIYRFSVEAVDVAGNASAMGPAVTIQIDVTPPKAIAIIATPITTAGGTTYDFTVTYGDNVAVNAASLDGKDLIVTGPFGYKQAAKLISVTGSGGSIVGHYRVPAPSAGWTGVYSGTYIISLQSGQIFDTAGNSAAAASIGTFKVSLPIVAPRTPLLAAVSDRGISSTDDLTNLNNSTPATVLQFIIIDTAPGGAVSLYSDGVLIGSATAKGTTTVVTTDGKTKLLNGVHKITARITPPGGRQTSDSAVLKVTILHEILNTPLAPVLQTASDSGISDHDGITNINTPAFTVSASSYYRMSVNGGVFGDSFLKGDVFDAQALFDGTYDFRVIAEDTAGNESTPSRPAHVVIDTTPPKVLAPGSLDPSFGNGGLVTTVAPGVDQIVAEALQADGRIVAAGPGVDPATGGTLIKVARYNRNGSLDSSFGTKGVTYVNLAATGTSVLTTLVMQADGRILLGGMIGGQFAVTRLLSSGTLDTTFGTKGHALISVPAGPTALNALLLQSDGRIIAAGQIAGGFGMLRLSVSGSLDKTFGVVITQFPQGVSSSIVSIAFTATKQIVAAGTTSNESFALARYSSAGVLDQTFGAAGIVTTSISRGATARRVLIQSDGKILLAGTIDSGQQQIGVARYNANGSLDPTFSVNGIINQALTSNVNVADMILQPDGKIVVAGTLLNADQSTQGFIARFTSNGLPDPVFGTAGSALFAPPGQSLDITCLVRHPDGNFVAGGSSTGSADSNFALARVLAGGTSLTLDPASDSGVNHSDGITNAADPIYDLLGRGNNFYRIYLNGILFSGPYETAATLLAPVEQGSVTFTLVDAAGNESAQIPVTPATFDTTPPIEEDFGGTPFISAATSLYQIRITYFDNVALDPTTIGNGDLLMTAPDGSTSAARLTQLSIIDLQRSIALYAITPPGGAWDGTNNGNYSVWLQAGQIADQAGNINTLQRVLTISVNVPPAPAPALGT